MLRRETGADRVAARLTGAVISAVNFSEVIKKSVERGAAADLAIAFVGSLSIPIIPFDEELAVLSAGLYLSTKAHGLSFADRACLALADKRGAEVLTTDRRWGELDLPSKVTLIREAH
jgi:ribonuclease VapC